MSTRLILLAPGDVIVSVGDQLVQRGVDVRVARYDYQSTDQNELPAGARAAETSPGQTREFGDRAGSGTSRVEVDPGTKGSAQRTSTESTSGSADAHVRDQASRSDAAQGDTASRDGLHAAGHGRAVGGGGDTRNTAQSSESPAGSHSMESRGPEAGPGVPFVATARIRDALRERGYPDIRVLGSEIPIPDRDRVLLFGAAALKELGVGQDENAAQKDAEAKLRRDKVRSAMTVERIHSAQRVNEEFPIKKRERQHLTPVVLVTNDPQYVQRAHILYTAPTGDLSWKETARKATQRRDIRAYAYGEHDKSPGEALLTLVDAL
ncbi:VP6(Hel) [Great Island virus]|uniref:VP6(Hel) n=1 Tax=Great Island virus TaxID=204269 RepID=E1AA97_9REOV|nr:VP6(Hel) [Great Island virus]ADM88600.1 VP6(Hel) [Great Island virus]